MAPNSLFLAEWQVFLKLWNRQVINQMRIPEHDPQPEYRKYDKTTDF